ncbi:hypothetical protein ACJ2A9_03000 [Anaerobacillus sp. MEB173]|uniref:hypothetical protein n=1 Tax=Anaerobacillus sp. MEB173 TaxID=3383345 RepID=UPI003F92E5F3
MANYIILTNKEDYQTDLNNKGLQQIETYNYLFFGKLKAKYTICKVIDDSIKIQLIEEKDGVSYINDIPVKFFEPYENIEQAQDELKELSGPDNDDSKLELVV